MNLQSPVLANDDCLLPTNDRRQKLVILDSAVAEPAPIDTNALASRCLGNMDFALMLLTEMEATGKQRVDDITRLAVHHDRVGVIEAAHSLKGAAAIIGAVSLQRVAAVIEATRDSEQTPWDSNLINRLQVEMDRCLKYIPVIRDSKHAISAS